MGETFLQSSKKCTFALPIYSICPSGGIGRRAGLKNQFQFWSAGSTPASGT